MYQVLFIHCAVIEDLTRKVGAAKSFAQVTDRSSLLKLLPQSQDELPPRRMVVRIVALDLLGMLLTYRYLIYEMTLQYFAKNENVFL